MARTIAVPVGSLGGRGRHRRGERHRERKADHRSADELAHVCLISWSRCIAPLACAGTRQRGALMSQFARDGRRAHALLSTLYADFLQGGAAVTRNQCGRCCISYSAGAGGASAVSGGDDGGAGDSVAGPRSGRSSSSSMAASASTRNTSAATNTRRNTAVMSTPAAPAFSISVSMPTPRCGAAPRVESRIAPMIATASELASARKKFMAPVAVPT